MNRYFCLVAFVPSVFGQIIFPDETHSFISSINATSGTPVDSTEVNQNSGQIPIVTTVMPSGAAPQDASSSLLPEVNMPTISDLQPVPPSIPGSFSAAATTITPSSNPTQVRLSTAVSTPSGIDTGLDEESLLPSHTSATSNVQPGFVRITPTPTIVSRTSIEPTGTEVPTIPPLTASPLPDSLDAANTFVEDPITSIEEVDNHLVITVMEDEEGNFVSEIDDLESCMTPLGEKGECTHLLHCQGYDVLRDKTDSRIAVNFLRGRVCRILPRSLLFCCPDEDPILPEEF